MPSLESPCPCDPLFDTGDPSNCIHLGHSWTNNPHYQHYLVLLHAKFRIPMDPHLPIAMFPQQKSPLLQASSCWCSFHQASGVCS